MNPPAEPPIVLKMVRSDLENLPEFPLPAGYRLRGYQRGDDELWQRIQTAADRLIQTKPALFAEQFGSDADLLRQRQLYLVENDGEVIGTGTAWFNDDFQGRRFGRIHWVALVPPCQGRGLGKPLISVLCRRLRELGHEQAYLSTSSARVPAIRLYRHFGFVPLIESETQAAVWRELGI